MTRLRRQAGSCRRTLRPLANHHHDLIDPLGRDHGVHDHRGRNRHEVFRTYVEIVLSPSLKEGDIVIMDNLAPHKNAATLELIAKAGAAVRFLPP